MEIQTNKNEESICFLEMTTDKCVVALNAVSTLNMRVTSMMNCAARNRTSRGALVPMAPRKKEAQFLYYC